MPNPQPTINKISDMMAVDAIDNILKDLLCAKEDYGTTFGESMLQTSIIKIKRLKNVYSGDESNVDSAKM